MPNQAGATSFNKSGFLLKKKLFNPTDIAPITAILEKFHRAWVEDNKLFYQSKAVNSAYITRPGYLNREERLALFDFITNNKILDALTPVVPTGPVFMGTQLFFNPSNLEQNNYWHRDMQYNSEPIEQQKANLHKQIPLHIRIALRDEPGIELIPGTHKRWDTDTEFQVRMEQNGHKNHEDLPGSRTIPMQAGDMLIFSANIIHRGIYGMDRFAFDLLFTDQNPEILKFADPTCLPDANMLKLINNPAPYERTMQHLQ